MKHRGAFRPRIVGGAVALLLLSGVVADVALSSLPASAGDCTLAAQKPNFNAAGDKVRGNGQINCSMQHTLTLTVALQIQLPTGWENVTGSAKSFSHRGTVFLAGSTDYQACARPARSYRSKATGTVDGVSFGQPDYSNLTVSC